MEKGRWSWPNDPLLETDIHDGITNEKVERWFSIENHEEVRETLVSDIADDINKSSLKNTDKTKFLINKVKMRY